MSEEVTKLTVKENGPLLVAGKFEVFSADGTEMAEGKGMVAICRCGATASQPFCNGAHAKIGFKG